MTADKPTILAIAPVYFPGYLAGGPVRSMIGLVENLSEDFRWKILTTDRDLGAKAPYPNIAGDSWTRVGKADVWYASAAHSGVSGILRVLRDTPYDLLYINSFFNPRFAILPAWAARFGLLRPKPVLIAPRGEFSTGALRLKSWKKKLYMTNASLASVYRNVFWHATAPSEAADLEREVGARVDRTFVASNLSVLRGAFADRARVPGEPLKVCFLGRISRKKNLDFALKALARVRQQVRFAVYGPAEDETYWQECRRLVEKLPSHVTFEYGGVLAPSEVSDVLAKHDLFFFPTRGENFGHVIVEALGAGVPILISDCTPWRSLDARGVGWDLPLGEEMLPRFAERIDEVALMSDEEFIRLRTNARAMAAEISQNPKAVSDSREMFFRAIGKI